MEESDGCPGDTQDDLSLAAPASRPAAQHHLLRPPLGCDPARPRRPPSPHPPRPRAMPEVRVLARRAGEPRLPGVRRRPPLFIARPGIVAHALAPSPPLPAFRPARAGDGG